MTPAPAIATATATPLRKPLPREAPTAAGIPEPVVGQPLPGPASPHTVEILASSLAAAIALLASVVSLAMPLRWSWVPLGAGVLARIAMLLRRSLYRDWHLASALLGTWVAERGVGKMAGIAWQDGSLGEFLVLHTGWEADALLIVIMLAVLAIGRLTRFTGISR